MSNVTPLPPRGGNNRRPFNATLPLDVPSMAAWSRELKATYQNNWLGHNGPIAETVQQEASRWLDVLEPAFAPVRLAMIYQWMEPIIFSVSNQRPPHEMHAWMAAAMLAFDETPSAAFNIANQREAVIAFGFWPSVADVSKVVKEAETRLQSMEFRLQRIADGGRPKHNPPPSGPISGGFDYA